MRTLPESGAAPNPHGQRDRPVSHLADASALASFGCADWLDQAGRGLFADPATASRSHGGSSHTLFTCQRSLRRHFVRVSLPFLKGSAFYHPILACQMLFLAKSGFFQIFFRLIAGPSAGLSSGQPALLPVSSSPFKKAGRLRQSRHFACRLKPAVETGTAQPRANSLLTGRCRFLHDRRGSIAEPQALSSPVPAPEPIRM